MIFKNAFPSKQRQFEEEIKIILKEMMDDDWDYSVTDSLRRVRLEEHLYDYRLFEKAALLKDQQVIILTSVQKVLIREGENPVNSPDF